MRADFYRETDSSECVGYAVWVRDGADVFSDDDGVEEALHRIFRATPVMTNDPSLTGGGPGPAVFQPGSLQWFKSAARTRSGAEGLAVTLVPGGVKAMGWDPAGSYRPFSKQLEHELESAAGGKAGHEEAGEQRPEGIVGPSAPGTEAAKPGPGPSAAGQSEQAPP